MISATLGAASGPVVTGWIYDVAASYTNAFVLHVVVFAAAAVTVSFVRRPAERKA